MQRSGELQLEASPGKYNMGPYLEKPFSKIRLVEWFKLRH
jgi:hypothetical protein